MREADSIAGPRLIGRIALASALVVALIAAALLVTVWSYRNALDAHSRADVATGERSVSRAAETYLAREREAMNEYLLDPRTEVRAEIVTDREGFRSNISKALNATEGRGLEASSVASRREAFLFAIFAGVLAIAGGLGSRCTRCGW